jgi:hypothetical protein
MFLFEHVWGGGKKPWNRVCGLSLEGPNNWVVASTHFDLVYLEMIMCVHMWDNDSDSVIDTPPNG